MCACEIGSTPYPCEAHVLDLMAGWAESNHPNQALNACGLVIFPNLVTLDRMPRSTPTTYLTATTRVLIDL
jgi:hypothetical protein